MFPRLKRWALPALGVGLVLYCLKPSLPSLPAIQPRLYGEDEEKAVAVCEGRGEVYNIWDDFADGRVPEDPCIDRVWVYVGEGQLEIQLDAEDLTERQKRDFTRAFCQAREQAREQAQ